MTHTGIDKSELKGRPQLARHATARADPATVWGILTDSRLLPQWVPAVRHVDRCETTGEAVGSVRHCSVELGGRAGRMVERCVGLNPQRSLAYLVEDESLGMAKMFADYGFWISLEPAGERQSRITVETFYTPRNIIYTLLNVLMLRRLYRRTVDDLLGGLVRLAEKRESQLSADSTAAARRSA